MFRTSYAYLQENHTVHAALYGMFSMRLCNHYACVFCYTVSLHYHIRLHVHYSLPEDERKMFETYRRQEELN